MKAKVVLVVLNASLEFHVTLGNFNFFKGRLRRENLIQIVTVMMAWGRVREIDLWCFSFVSYGMFFFRCIFVVFVCGLALCRSCSKSSACGDIQCSSSRLVEVPLGREQGCYVYIKEILKGAKVTTNLGWWDWDFGCSILDFDVGCTFFK